ncbi:hypothetical protein C0Q70_01745 [Pomacea canaliculata]|uniref:Uncharacterized protein n=1 Tax=Pomacea canaliculata TaxID=400727 RepID=A0A2T7Q0F0_POMCA|nr:hypothetical protein C0Q70_01745 [Pomacea canaliculata]
MTAWSMQVGVGGWRGEWRESRHTNCNRSPGTGESLMRGQGGVFTAQPHDRGMQSARLKMKYCLDAWFICSHAKKIIIFAINTDFRDKRASNILAHKTCVPVSDNGWVHPSFVIIKTTSNVVAGKKCSLKRDSKTECVHSFKVKRVLPLILQPSLVDQPATTKSRGRCPSANSERLQRLATVSGCVLLLFAGSAFPNMADERGINRLEAAALPNTSAFHRGYGRVGRQLQGQPQRSLCAHD